MQGIKSWMPFYFSLKNSIFLNGETLVIIKMLKKHGEFPLSLKIVIFHLLLCQEKEEIQLNNLSFSEKKDYVHYNTTQC